MCVDANATPRGWPCAGAAKRVLKKTRGGVGGCLTDVDFVVGLTGVGLAALVVQRRVAYGIV